MHFATFQHISFQQHLLNHLLFRFQDFKRELIMGTDSTHYVPPLGVINHKRAISKQKCVCMSYSISIQPSTLPITNRHLILSSEVFFKSVFACMYMLVLLYFNSTSITPNNQSYLILSSGPSRLAASRPRAKTWTESNSIAGSVWISCKCRDDNGCYGCNGEYFVSVSVSVSDRPNNFC